MCGACDFMTNGTISLLTRYELVSVPPVILCPCHLAWVASGRCPVFFQVVKTTQSRERRTEGTLLTR
jgi:hypothetical protein